jgi:hypothetical protein
MHIAAADPRFSCVGSSVGRLPTVTWPALVRLAKLFDKRGLAAIRETHVPSGAHKVQMLPFPLWMTPQTRRLAERLSEEDASAQLGEWIHTYLREGRATGASSRTR